MTSTSRPHYDRRFGPVYPMFQLLGCALVPLHGQVLSSLYTLTAVIVSSYIVIELGVIAFSLIEPGTIFFLSDATGTFADAIQFEIPLTVPLVSVVLSIIKLPLQRRIAQLMDSIDERIELTPGTLDSFNHKLANDILATVLIYNVIPTVNELFIISRISANVVWYRNWWFKIWFFILIRIGDSFFLLHVEYIRNRYAMLNHELQLTGQNEMLGSFSSNAAKVQVPPGEVHHRVVRLKAAQNLLKELTDNVNDRFGWQLFCVIVMLFVCTTIDGYWMYASLYHDGNLYKVESFLCGISPLLMFYMLFSKCQRCLNEGEMTFYHLHNVLCDPLPVRTIDLIQRFSKQLNNERVHFSAANFFELNLGALTTIFASITTYLVIYINFIPKTDTFDDYNKAHNLSGV
ncbi:putative gustatory receptor 39b [Anopheles cruzii]|uniref:putative gustatory receptor 39b n=1 Tax=Anopheles cruzii TaxID=68878 RepID=UPI0022EC4D6E|nr:putative gustatory receptor 39b [Anopheles cruzii]